MPDVLMLGPLAVPLPVLLTLAAVLLAHGVAGRLGARSGVSVERSLWVLLLVTFGVARLAFVWRYREAYLASPGSLLDIRDGGWDGQAGVVAAWLVTFAQVRRQPALRRPLLVAVGSASALWIAGSVALMAGQLEDRRLPALSVGGLDGQVTSLVSFEGKPTVVNLWATWCPPCRREMPALAQAQQRHPDVHFVFLNQGEPAERVQRYLSAQGLNLRHVLLDTRGEAGALFGPALPTTLFFDAQGRLVERRIGEVSAATLAQRLQALGVAPIVGP